MMHKKLLLVCSALVLALCSFVFRPMPVNIVFIGDSITQAVGVKDAQTQAPSVIAVRYLNQLGLGTVQGSNQGRSGFTTVDFLPTSKKAYAQVVTAADVFIEDKSAQLVFSIMLGTNDSAVKGPNGSPVSAAAYHANLKVIADSLLVRYPACKIVLNRPVWYSDSTHNSSIYLTEGRDRLNSYLPEMKALVKEYKATNPGHIYLGDTDGYNYFKRKFLTDMNSEKGQSGIFYLHPNEKGSAALGLLWGKAIASVLKD